MGNYKFKVYIGWYLFIFSIKFSKYSYYYAMTLDITLYDIVGQASSWTLFVVCAVHFISPALRFIELL